MLGWVGRKTDFGFRITVRYLNRFLSVRYLLAGSYQCAVFMVVGGFLSVAVQCQRGSVSAGILARHLISRVGVQNSIIDRVVFHRHIGIILINRSCSTGVSARNLISSGGSTVPATGSGRVSFKYRFGFRSGGHHASNRFGRLQQQLQRQGI